MSIFFLYLIAVGAGVSVAFQQVLNASLRVQIGSPWWAAVVSYVVGLLFTLALALIIDGSKITEIFAKSGPILPWLGGIFGAIFIASVVLMVPKLGAATTISLIVVGQMLLSLAFDHFGLFGLSEQPITVARVAGAISLLLGVVLIRA